MNDMDLYRATMIAEGLEEADEETYNTAWQWLVTTGMIHHLQGWYGRTAHDMIEQGIISAP